jgi:hypothetical protein
MSHRSVLKRRREKKRRKHAQQRKLALQLPVLRTISTADLFAEIQRRTTALAEIFDGKL